MEAKKVSTAKKFSIPTPTSSSTSSHQYTHSQSNRQLHQITPGVTSYAAGNAWIPGPAPDVAGFSHGVRLGAKPAPPHRLILPPLGATTDNGNFHRFADFGYFGKPESYEKDLGLPRNRIGAGRIGSSWRHINQVQARGI